MSCPMGRCKVGEILRLAARTQQTSDLDWKFKKKFIKGKWEQVEPNTFGDQGRKKDLFRFATEETQNVVLRVSRRSPEKQPFILRIHTIPETVCNASALCLRHPKAGPTATGQANSQGKPSKQIPLTFLNALGD